MDQQKDIPTDHFECEGCGGVFRKGWSDEESKEEAIANFGDLVGEDDALFCDDCYKKFMDWLGTQQ